MDQTFDVYVLFGEYRIVTDEGRSYHKVPLTATLSIAQAQHEWQLFDQYRDWLPEGAEYLNAYVAPRTIEMYPESFPLS